MRISGFAGEPLKAESCPTNCWWDAAKGKCECQPYGPGELPDPFKNTTPEVVGGNAGKIVFGVIVGTVALVLITRGLMGSYVGKKAGIRYGAAAGLLGGTTGLAAASLLD